MKLLEVADSIALKEVNAVAASVLSYISHYRNEAALLEEAGPDYTSRGYATPGPTRMTSIVACVPAYVDASGQSTGVPPVWLVVDRAALLHCAVSLLHSRP